EVSFYTRALSAAEVHAIPAAGNEGKGPLPAPTDSASWWRFEETTGPTAADASGSNPGTLTGSTSVPGKVGAGRRFTAADAMSASGSGTLNITGNQLTIDAWIKLENNPTTGQAFAGIVG